MSHGVSTVQGVQVMHGGLLRIARVRQQPVHVEIPAQTTSRKQQLTAAVEAETGHWGRGVGGKVSDEAVRIGVVHVDRL